MRLSAVEEPTRTAEIRISSVDSRNSRHIRKMNVHRHLAGGRDTSTLLPVRFYTTKTQPGHRY
jgi:hypothetical protein